MRIPILLLALTALPMAAQRPAWRFDAGLGVTTPTGALDDRVQDGSQVQFAATWEATRRFALRTELAFTSARISERQLARLEVPDGTLSTWSLTLDPIWRLGRPGGRAVPYLVGGAGVARRTVEYTSPTTATVIVYDPWWDDYYPATVGADVVIGRFTQTRLTLNAGAGLEFGTGSPGTRWFLEARYTEIFTHPVRTTYVPVVVGVRF